MKFNNKWDLLPDKEQAEKRQVQVVESGRGFQTFQPSLEKMVCVKRKRQVQGKTKMENVEG